MIINRSLATVWMSSGKTSNAPTSTKPDIFSKSKDWIARTGYDPVYGARPLKRLIQKDIENPLALKLLSGVFADGDRIGIDVKDDALEFKREGSLVSVGSTT